MNKTLSILLLALAPLLSQAGDDPHAHHAGGHDMAAMPVAAAGQPGDPAAATRTIALTVGDDLHINPERIEIKAGETVRLFVRNTGRQTHELALGTAQELRAHAEMMRSMPGMSHAGPNLLRLGPGQRGGLVWRFDQAGELTLGCLVAGHLQAGMAGKVVVE